MATVDSLDIQISAQVNKANAAITALSGKLDRLSASLSGVNSRGLATLGAGVNKLANAMSNFSANTKTADFSRLARNLNSIGAIDTSKFSDIASKMSQLSASFNGFSAMPDSAQQIGDFAKNISKLGNKGVQNAIANMPQLANAVKNLFQTLSTAPTVSQNTIQMANALANLAAQGGKVGTASRTMVSGLNSTASAMNRAKSSSTSLAVAFGKFYASYFIIIRGIRKLWDSIESSFDYIEVLNYFDAAFGQVASKADLSAFEKMGYESAEAYYGSFAQRAEELTAKMSGFTVGKGGLLESTGAVSLGLDPSQLMNYQAMFGQMSSSMGIASETALKLSQALTEIGADLASVKNLDFKEVWEDMASGLAGMSRTLDKYGVNIRNVNLQQKLSELGIEANIQALNQNDKALLRAIILLEDTKYAWGDLADTINQPANQLRLIQANFRNLSRTIGNMFLPLVKTVLPYINALVIALQRFFAWVGSMMGIDLSDISTSIGGADLGNILDQTEELEGNLSGAKKESDKLKKSLRSFDELKVISTKDDSALSDLGGLGNAGLLDEAFDKAFSEYQKKWDEAFAGLENRAQEIADSIGKAFEPLKSLLENLFAGNFELVGKDVSNLVSGIFDFFADAIDKVDWNGIGKKIGEFVSGLDWKSIFKSAGNAIWQGLKAAFELYIGELSAAPLETAIVSLVAFPKLLKAITASKFITGIRKLWKNLKTCGEKISLATGALAGNKAAASGLYMFYPKLSKKVDEAKDAFKKFFVSVKDKGFWKTVDGGITNIRNNLGGLQKAAIVAVAGFAEFSVVSDSVKKLTKGTENWLAEIGKIAGVAAAAAAAMYTALGPAGLAIAGITGVIGAIEGINSAFEEIRAKEVGESIKKAMTTPGGTPLSEITSNFAKAFSNAASGFDTIKEKSSEMDVAQKNIKDTWLEIEQIQTAMKNGVISVDEGKQELERLFGELATLTETKFSAISESILAAYGEGGAFSKVFKEMGVDTEYAIDTMISFGYRNEEEVKKIIKALSEMSPEDKYYDKLMIRLAELTKDESKFEKATKEFADNMGLLKNKIDYSELFPNEGEINEELLKSYLGEISEALKEYNRAVDEAGKEIKKEWEKIVESPIATKEEKELARKQITEVLPEAIQTLKENAGLEAKLFTDMIQNDFIDRTSIILDEAVSKWEEKKWYQKWLGGIFKESEKKYVDDAIDKHTNNMEKLGNFIEEKFKELGINGAGWASDSAKEMRKKLSEELFNSEYIPSEIGVGHYKYTIKEEYSKIVSDVSESVKKEAKPKFQNVGEQMLEGLIAGAESKKSKLEKTMQGIANKISNAVKNTLQIHSPSKVMFDLGDYTMQGFEEGMESLYQPILKSAKLFSRDLQVASVPSINDMYDSYQYQNMAYAPQYGIAEYPQNSYNQSNVETNALLRQILDAVKEGKTITIGQDEVGKASVRYIQGEERRLQKSIVGTY